jgi:hypothetical protein
MFTALSFGLCAFVFVHLGKPLLAVGKVIEGTCDVYLTMGDGVSVPRFPGGALGDHSFDAHLDKDYGYLSIDHGGMYVIPVGVRL